MKKKIFLMALVGGAALTSCSNHDFETWSESEKVQANYEAAFIQRFGQPNPNHTWGFGDVTRSAMTRSAANPEVLSISAPYTEAWVAEYLTTAKEPNSANVADNYDNGTIVSVQWDATEGGKLKAIMNNYDNFVNYGTIPTGMNKEECEWYGANIKPMFEACGWNWNWNNDTSIAQSILDKLSEYTGDYNYWGIKITREAGKTEDTTFVLNFKITGTWDGNINVLGTPGIGETAGYERSVVVTGKWNLTSNQVVGAKGRIIVANGGEIEISSEKILSSTQEAQIVVLPGGKITGKGTIEFCNGTDSNLQSYNGGTISVGKFNNNGGDFFNYGTLKATVMDGGAGNSHYYNHGIININETGSSANLRIYNGCQFYCSGSMRARNYEGVQGSSLICGGELMFSGSEDGTSEESYVGLAAGALVQCGTLNNNGTKWYGPTTGGYAVLDITNNITFINNQAGDFANNIYVCAGTWNNTLSQGNLANKTAKEAIETVKTNTVTIIEKSTDPNDNLIPADNDFKAGVKGCTPGFNGKTPDTPAPTPSANIRVIAEDLTVDEKGDFDFNDVVFDIILKEPAGKTTIILQAAGGTLPLKVAGREVHEAFGVNTNVMVNTGSGVTKDPVTFTVDGELDAKAVKVEVEKNGEWIELMAEKGRAPGKIAVPVDYEWCNERQDIETKYSLFKEYVKEPKLNWTNYK